jgi:LSD1 subclass zinc finger protein
MNENALTFECPSCGASLQNPGGAATMKCGYCGTTVVVPEELRAIPQTNMGRGSPPAANISQLFAQAMEMGAIVQLVRKGDRADAIRLYQENTGVNSEQAERVIDAIASGETPNSGMRSETKRAPRTRRPGCSGIIVFIILIVGAYFVIQYSTGPVHDFLNHWIAQLNLTNIFR